MSGSIFKKGARPQTLLDSACKTRTINEDKSWSVGYLSGLGWRWQSIIANSINDKAHPIEKLQTVIKIFNTRQHWKEKDFSSAYRTAFTELKSQARRYLVVFPISGEVEYLSAIPFALLPNLMLCTDLEVSVQAAILECRAKIRKECEANVEGFERIAYVEDSSICVEVDASSTDLAHAIARERLEEVLGLLLLVSDHTSSRISTGLNRPVFKLLIAPFATVHLDSGLSADDRFWYDQWNGSSRPSSIKEEDISNARDNFAKLFAFVERSKWKDDCLRALRLYFQFGSEVNVKTAFLTAWKLMELVTSGDRTSYDEVVARSSRFYVDSEVFELTASFFKDLRNSLSHSRDESPFDEDDILFHFKVSIRHPLIHFLQNVYAFENKDEYLEFCDAGNSAIKVRSKLDKTKRAVYVLESALKFVGDH